MNAKHFSEKNAPARCRAERGGMLAESFNLSVSGQNSSHASRDAGLAEDFYWHRIRRLSKK